MTAEMHSNLQKLRQRMDSERIDLKSMFKYLDVYSNGYLNSEIL
jgi:hypothetical protein